MNEGEERLSEAPAGRAEPLQRGRSRRIERGGGEVERGSRLRLRLRGNTEILE